ncbi:MAG: adenylosuccinate lyase [Verrucomicrobiota bacterium]
MIPNVLAERYATPPMQAIWSPEGKIVLEREFWIAVMKAQQSLGLDIPGDAIADYESAKENVDLDAIMERERVTRHDVKARIEEFNHLAGHEHIHKGLTSRDLTENVEQLQIFRALNETRFKSLATLSAFARRATQFRDLVISARTHNVAAQITTLGKRLAMNGEELLLASNQIDHLINSYPARGLKGAVGTRLDQLNLFNGDAEKAAALDNSVSEHLGIPATLNAVGQVYPRSLDLSVVSALCQISSGPSSFATTLRLMAGHELAGEGFAKGQTGSSAMPHKMNSRSCERINGFHTILQGHLNMASSLAGDQWNEGDVSCSVVRRVMLPDAFFAIDGSLETTLTVLEQMTVHKPVIERENQRYLPFLLSTTFLMAAVKNGVGRETAHAAVKEHALATLDDLRSGAVAENDLLRRLANDERLGLDLSSLENLFESGKSQTAAAHSQVDHFSAQVEQLVKDTAPNAADYRPGNIL